MPGSKHSTSDRGPGNKVKASRAWRPLTDRRLLGFPSFLRQGGFLVTCAPHCAPPPPHDLPKSGFLADRHKKLTVYCVAFFFLMKLDRCLQKPARVLLTLPFTVPLAHLPVLEKLRQSRQEQLPPLGEVLGSDSEHFTG